MKYIDEFRGSAIAKRIAKQISGVAKDLGSQTIMEVCGTHTMAIHRFAIRDLIPENIKLISGPGCPVCVTPKDFIDRSISFARLKNTIITSFGDMLRVPGSNGSLESLRREEGRDIKVVYSPLDSLEFAKENLEKKVIFLGIGFETTAPCVAATIIEAKENNIKNFFVYCGHKLMPPVMLALVSGNKIAINGFICPAHVSTIIGARPYEFIVRHYLTPCVICGFEPLDILQGILMLLSQLKTKESKVEIQYKRVAKREGNVEALELLRQVFEVSDSTWRGIGFVPDSGLRINRDFEEFDAERNFSVEVEEFPEDNGCICGDILQGMKVPSDCPLFKNLCSPENPQGACMVSSEGTCAAYYKYGN